MTRGSLVFYVLRRQSLNRQVSARDVWIVFDDGGDGWDNTPWPVAHATVLFGALRAGVAWIDYLEVAENRRRAGVGTRVIEALREVYKRIDGSPMGEDESDPSVRFCDAVEHLFETEPEQGGTS